MGVWCGVCGVCVCVREGTGMTIASPKPPPRTCVRGRQALISGQLFPMKLYTLIQHEFSVHRSATSPVVLAFSLESFVVILMIKWIYIQFKGSSDFKNFNS